MQYRIEFLSWFVAKKESLIANKNLIKIKITIMKKLSLLIIVLFLGITSIYAQGLDIRAYGGVNVLQLTSDKGTSLIDGTLHNKKVSGRPGYQFGAALTFGERFFVQPGFEYALLSTKLVNENTVTGKELTDETTLGVFSVPLKVGYRLLDPQKENIFNIRVFTGFVGHHVASVNHTTKSGAFDITKDDYTNLILNADFGMGLDLFIFYLDVGYQFGLSPVHATGDMAKANSFYTNLGIRLTF